MKLVPAHQQLLSFQREGEGEHFHVLLNLGYDLVQIPLKNATVVISTHLDRDSKSVNGSLGLRPAEGVVLSLHDSL